MTQTVSIVIPVYKSAATVRRCVESLVGGTYPHLEILLVEDCSPDNSWEVCQELAAQYPCVRTFRNERNSGPSVTRNRGLEEMTGEYLMFVDSDDWVEPDFVESFLSARQSQAPGLVVCGYWNQDEISNQTDIILHGNDTQMHTTLPMKATLTSLYHGRLLQQIWNKLFIADIIRTNHVRFDPNIRIGEDFHFLLTYLEHFPHDQLTLINRPLYHYIRSGTDSLMFQMNASDFADSMTNLERLYTFLGTPEQERQTKLAQAKVSTLNTWAYMIMHSPSITKKEKKRQILLLDAKLGKKLYRDARTLYLKEQIFQIMKRLHLR
jgi:glycosyltransferase involved in cell wall biosynthesis